MIKNIAKNFIPNEYHWKAYNKYRDFFGWENGSYSTFGEDLVVAKLLKNKKNGFFVDVGAFHPMKYSNTFYFYKNKGWTGISIEPNPDNFKLFEKFRKKDINLNIGIAKQENILTYYMFNDGLYNSFNKDQVTKTEQQGHPCLSTCEIKVWPLNKILEKYGKGIDIDFLNVDVESLDLEVLQSIDWSRSRPKVIAIEDLEFDLNNPNKSQIFEYLVKHDYHLDSKCHFTLIFLDKNL